MISRDDMIDKLVDKDIESISDDMLNGDFSLLDSILRGEGWIQYNNMSDGQIKSEYLENFPQS